MIELENVIKKYGDRVVLNIPSLRIDQGERVALTGPNGSGKSTLLRIIAGVISSEGRVNADGKILYMPQKNTAFDMTVLNNVTFFMTGKKKEKEEKAFEALKKVGLSSLYKKNALTLSGGETARLALARLIVKDCDILLLDEPTGEVDIEGTLLIENIVKEYLAEKNRTLVISTHSPAQSGRIASRIIMLGEAEIKEDMTRDDFLREPKTDFGKKFVDMWRY